ncbi:MAG: ImmA/IrrE family metallo-endopeptidase [Acidobacteriia bacterium]|nr:ImmA/IrrE family metallo-endopeptidase [Terriglobia bacterium]
MPPAGPVDGFSYGVSRLRLRFAALVAALLVWAAPGAGQSGPRAQALCGQANAIAQDLTRISGMKLRRRVPCDFISKEKINQFLNKRVKDVASPEEIRAEELTLKKFGLVPRDFDLAKSTVELLTEQAAAFYDYNKKKLFITESTPSDTQEPVLAHELSHALADQNFNLARFIRQGRKSDDGATARLAVMEGQATWLMSEYLARKSGQSLKDSPALVAAMSNLSDSGAGQYPIYENAPLYLRRTLVFPYTKGMLFQNAVFQRDGEEGFGEVFRRAPVSTQQIVHPEKYFAGLKPTRPALPDPHLPRGYKGLVGGSLGELEHGILIEQYAGKERAAEIAPHWRGSIFELRENKKARRVVLLYAAEWDSEESARAYFAVYREALGKKWRNLAVASESADSVSGTGDDGRFLLRRDGATVTSMEGLDPAIH